MRPSRPLVRSIAALAAGLLVVSAGLPALAQSGAASSDGSAEAAEDAPKQRKGWDPILDVPWPRIGEVSLDLFVLRPLSGAATVAGFGYFLISVPFVYFEDRVDQTWDIFVLAPADYTVNRPLGDF